MNPAPCRLPVRELGVAVSNKLLGLAQDYPKPARGIKLGLVSTQIGPERFHCSQLIRARHPLDWQCYCQVPNMEELAPTSKAKRPETAELPKSCLCQKLGRAVLGAPWEIAKPRKFRTSLDARGALRTARPTTEPLGQHALAAPAICPQADLAHHQEHAPRRSGRFLSVPRSPNRARPETGAPTSVGLEYA